MPLIEIVTEPDLRTAAEASAFFEQLRATLVWIGVNDGNMEEGSLRCDANVSVRPAGESRLGTKAEVKNLNSFRYLRQALEYEIERQIDLVDSGRAVTQETRLWDQATSRTITMRSKEEAHDYRYFPEPDLPPVDVDAGARGAGARGPARVAGRTARPLDGGVRLVGLRRDRADAVARDGRLVCGLVTAGAPAKAAANWLMGEMSRALNDAGLTLAESPISADGIGRADRSGRAARDQLVDRQGGLREDVDRGATATDIVEADGLAQISDEAALAAAVDQVLAAHPEPARQYRAGQTKVLGFLVGQVMKATGGKASPALVNELMRRALDRGLTRPRAARRGIRVLDSRRVRACARSHTEP